MTFKKEKCYDKISIERKIKNEMLEKSKKAAFYTGVATVSAVGVYISYKTIKDRKSVV